MRIVSLIASATEILCALGLEGSLVGRSHECDYPPSVKSLPACSEPKLNIHTCAKEIDDQVKRIVADSLAVYRVHTDTLKKLNPDLIVTQDQCEVCAVSLKDVEAAVCAWTGGRPQVVSLSPQNLEELFESILTVGEAAKVLPKAEEVVKELKKRMRAIEDKVKSFSLERKQRIVCIEWMDPLMAAGNWVPEIVEKVQGENLFGESGKHSPWMTWEELRDSNPDKIIIMPCGWGIERIQEEMPVLERLEGWTELSAVAKQEVYLTDGNHYFNRPGPRIVESFEILAEILYPQIFHFGHQGRSWKKA